MPDPKIHPVTGIPSTLLVYDHPKTYTDKDGHEQTFHNRTIQYNPRTSGKGFYKALKGGRANIRGSIAFTRYMCQQRIVQLLAARSGGTPPADPNVGVGVDAGVVETPRSGEARAENVV